MAVAKRLRGAIGVGDFLARFGGDEFAVMHTGDEKSALELSERMTKSFEENFDLYGQSIRMTASIGMARAASSSAGARCGWNTLVFFTTPMDWQQRLWPTEEFELARSRVPVSLPETDLFAGIEGRE